MSDFLPATRSRGALRGANVQSLEERLERLENIEAIRRLKLRYAELCDDGYNADKLAELFTEDCVFDSGELGAFHGREEIRQAFKNVSSEMTFAIHYMTAHQIDIAPGGLEATGTWNLWQPTTLNGKAVLLAGTYHDRYRKVNGVWMFAFQSLEAKIFTPYEVGWGPDRFGSLTRLGQ